MRYESYLDKPTENRSAVVRLRYIEFHRIGNFNSRQSLHSLVSRHAKFFSGLWEKVVKPRFFYKKKLKTLKSPFLVYRKT